TAKDDGLPVTHGGVEKMSKSKNNVVEPRDIIAKFGADTARSFTMFAGPPDQSAAWSNSGAEGTFRFLRRLWNFARAQQTLLATAEPIKVGGLSREIKDMRREIHSLLKQAEFDFDRMQYNTVVSATMKMLNTIEGAKLDAAGAAVARECVGILLRVLYPIAPHIAHSLWNDLEYGRDHGEILDAPWPQPAADALVADEIELVVQVNGKLRGSIRVPAGADKAAIEAAALADADVQRFVEGKPVKKLIVVPGKLVNVVV
ncbi:MAG: class I tRNA ligase family protein, partial [Burkholderiaceae bacterium]